MVGSLPTCAGVREMGDSKEVGGSEPEEGKRI